MQRAPIGVALASFLAFLASIAVHGANVTCPAYRQFNDSLWSTDNPDPISGLSAQYLAPSGCECVDGMTDMHCKFCTTDEACQTEHANSYCKTGFTVTGDEKYISYKCNVSPSLELIYPRGKVSFHMDIVQQTAHVVLYNSASTDPINGKHNIQCDFWDCDLTEGEEDFECEESCRYFRSCMVMETTCFIATRAFLFYLLSAPTFFFSLQLPPRPMQLPCKGYYKCHVWVKSGFCCNIRRNHG